MIAVLLALLVASCSLYASSTSSGPPASERATASTATTAPVPTASPTAPLSSFIAPARPSPTNAPAQTPSARPTVTSAEATFYWASEMIINDADDIPYILMTIRHPGILDGYGDEQSITIRYDPSRITPEEIRARLNSAGHPVEP